MTERDKKLVTLLELLNSLQPKVDPRILLLGDNFVLFKDKNNFVLTRYFSEDIHKDLTFERGEILESFSKIEVLVNTLIVHLIVKEGDNEDYLYDVLDGLNLHSKISLLEDWRIITNAEKNLFIRLKGIRNKLAHSWGIDNILYRDGYLRDPDTFKQFIEDISAIWDLLKSKYSPDLDVLIDKYKALLE